jgi:hypothetical protein
MTTNRSLNALVTTNYTYNAANQLLSTDDTTFTYDSNGNRATKLSSPPAETASQANYEYDAENRLVHYSRSNPANGKVIEQLYNQYDGFGRRLSKRTQQGTGPAIPDVGIYRKMGYSQVKFDSRQERV